MLPVLLLTVPPLTALGGEADVIDASAIKTSDMTYRFAVTVRHADAGWDHYADKWDILGPDDTVLGSRVLLHPHVGEQPFTRSLSDVRIPAGTDAVTIRAHDSVHGYGGKEVTVKIP